MPDAIQNWYERSLDDESSAERYFSIGHGDFNKEEGFESCFKIWVLLHGEILSSPEYCPDENGNAYDVDGNAEGTHQWLWGQGVNHAIKGRYETETHRLSVVLPHVVHKMTRQLLSKLTLALGPVSSVDVFK